jgi:hypothetical protein
MKGISFLILLILSSCASDPRDGKQVLNESLRQCYVESDSYTGRKGTVQGEMTVSLLVDSEDKVKSCKIVKNDFKDPNLNACVCGMFKLSTVSNPTKETIEVVQPVKFYPVQQ